jgi:6-phosphogluconolactonase
MDKTYVYIGSYAEKNVPGIHQYEYNPLTGELTFLHSIEGILNPSFLTINAKKDRLYSVSEEETEAGNVAAFAIHPSSGELTYVNERSSLGGAPCHVILDQSEKFLFVANYNGGNVNLFPLLEDGSIGVISDNVIHSGEELQSNPQAASHPHSVMVSPSNEFFMVPDLGLDTIFTYRIDKSKKLKLHNKIDVKQGAGPRHFVFHPTGKYGYVINELNSTITVFSYSDKDGILAQIQSITTLPIDYTGTNYCADIHIGKEGQFLYGSNRGHDSIAVYAINQDTGHLTFIEHTKTKGQTPRNFVIDPLGKFLLVANQNSNSIVTFEIDARSGRLIDTGYSVEAAKPVCIKF